ncbi:MAG: glutathione S-transferase [Pseudomonadota bacterium]
MSYTLYIGDYAYSSWSLRGWLLINRFGLSARQQMIPFHDQNVAEQMANVAPAKTVPTLVTEDGAIISESLSIAEELASRHPDAGIWPSDPAARATARTLCAEMATGFTDLRGDCPMNLRVAYSDSQPSGGVMKDIARIEVIWAHARTLSDGRGPWLFGSYSAADAFFAPVAGRIAGYNLPVSDKASAYVAAHLADPAFRRWRAMGLVYGETLEWYKKPYPQTEWPGPKPLEAQALPEGTAENDRCPYSGKPVTHLMTMQGRVFGFCNAFCRDKTVADPEAWPDFMKLI